MLVGFRVVSVVHTNGGNNLLARRACMVWRVRRIVPLSEAPVQVFVVGKVLGYAPGEGLVGVQVCLPVGELQLLMRIGRELRPSGGCGTPRLLGAH